MMLVTFSRRLFLFFGALFVFWFSAMASLPIVIWVVGEHAIPSIVTFVLLVQFAVVFLMLLLVLPVRSVVMSFLVCSGVAWLFEFFGSSLGFPFGGYDYTNYLNPKFLGVPLLIPLAWFMMLPTAWAIAAVITPKRRVFSPAAYVLVSALAITAWDLFLDPQMVSWGFWVWENPQAYGSTYFGIPWVNYAGWVLTGCVITALVRPWRFRLPLEPLLIIYAMTWFLQSLGLAFFWGQPGPALAGAIGMGAFVLLAVRSYLRSLSPRTRQPVVDRGIRTISAHD